MLYVEQPAGVGFSYADHQVEMGDAVAAKLNTEFILAFFKAFPERQNNDFYISGESYAGVYIPMFADNLIQHNAAAVNHGGGGGGGGGSAASAAVVNLKGLIIGNGCNGETRTTRQ